MLSSSVYFLRSREIARKESEIKRIVNENNDLIEKIESQSVAPYVQVVKESKKLEIILKKEEEASTKYLSRIASFKSENDALEEKIKQLESELSSPPPQRPSAQAIMNEADAEISFLNKDKCKIDDDTLNLILLEIRKIRQKYLDNASNRTLSAYQGRDEEDVLLAVVNQIFKTIDAKLPATLKSNYKNVTLKFTILYHFFGSELNERDTSFSKKILLTLNPILGEYYFKQASADSYSEQSFTSLIIKSIHHLNNFVGAHSLLTKEECSCSELLYELNEAFLGAYLVLLDLKDDYYEYIIGLYQFVSQKKAEFFEHCEGLAKNINVKITVNKIQ